MTETLRKKRVLAAPTPPHGVGLRTRTKKSTDKAALVVQGDPGLTLDAYWASPAGEKAWGVVALSPAEMAGVPAAVVKTWAVIDPVVWHLEHEAEAATLALLANEVARHYDDPERMLRRCLVPCARPPCTVQAWGKTWYVRADFAPAVQLPLLDEVAAQAMEYYTDLEARNLMTPEAREDQAVFRTLMTKARAGAKALPAVLWQPLDQVTLIGCTSPTLLPPEPEPSSSSEEDGAPGDSDVEMEDAEEEESTA